MSEFENNEAALEEGKRKFEEYSEQLAKLKEDAVIIVSHWGRIGSGGTLVTNAKELYRYKIVSFVNLIEYLVRANGKPVELGCFINKVKELTEEEYEKVITLIENEIIDKDVEWHVIFDAGYSVEINYNGINKKIKNDEATYYKAEKLLDELADSTD